MGMLEKTSTLGQEQQIAIIAETLEGAATKESHSLPVGVSIDALPAVTEVHFQAALDYLHRYLGLPEHPCVEEEFGALAQDFADFSRGTVFLRRRTDAAEYYWFFRCLRAREEGVLRSPHQDDAFEQQLLRLPGLQVVDFSKPIESHSPEGSAAVAFLASLASTVVLALVGVVTKKIGTMALDYIVKVLKIDPVADNKKDYEELVKLIKTQADDKVIEDMTRLLRSAVDALNSYNKGVKSESVLATAYNRVNELMGYRSLQPDATIVQANALALNLAVIQEFGILQGGRGRYSSYQSMVNNAPEYAKRLSEMHAQSWVYRFRQLSLVKSEYIDPKGAFHKVWWEDKGEDYYEERKWIADHDVNACIREMTIRRDAYSRIREEAFDKAFTHVDQLVLTLESLGRGIIKGSQLSIGNEQHVWMTLHGMVFRFGDGKWEPVFVDLKADNEPENVWFSEVAVGADGTVMLLFNQIHEVAPQPSALCELVDGQWRVTDRDCQGIAVGDANHIWKIDSKQRVHRREVATGAWQQIPGRLAKIAVGADGTVWGLDSRGAALRYSGTDWHDLRGDFAGISVGKAGVVWGNDADGRVFYYSGRDSEPWVEAGFPKTANLAVGPAGIPWFEDEEGSLWEATHWHRITKTGPTADVTAASDQLAYCLDEDGKLYQFNRDGRGLFEEMQNPPDCELQGVSYGINPNRERILCGIQKDDPKGTIWHHQIGTPGWYNGGGQHATSLSYGTTLWGLLFANQVHYIDESRAGWKLVHADVAARQISAGTDYQQDAVWVLLTVPGIPHRIDGRSTFVPIGTKAFNYISVGSAQHVAAIDEKGQVHVYDPQ
ncbi:MAG: hypothetical protein KDC54_08575 [Lewinella sp.]|nr:hypothetical protein [Lewinella sp.]